MFNIFKSIKDTTNPTEITSEMKDDAKSYLSTLLEKANFNAMVVLNNDTDDIIYLIIEDETDTARIIGKDGSTLQSLQLITQSYLTKTFNQYVPLFVDCNDYFSYRIEKAQSKAKELEETLSDDRTSIELFPMTALERKAIHTLYKDHDRFYTHSIGKGEDRRIVLSLKGA